MVPVHLKKIVKEVLRKVSRKALKEALRGVLREALKELLLLMTIHNCFHVQRVKTNTYRKGH
jgi:hypothetical protein